MRPVALGFVGTCEVDVPSPAQAMQFRCPETFALRTGLLRSEDRTSLWTIVQVHQGIDRPHGDTAVACEGHIELSVGVADPGIWSVLFGDVHAGGIVPDHVLDKNQGDQCGR